MCDITFARGRQEAEHDLYREEERHENAADYPVDELHILVPMPAFAAFATRADGTIQQDHYVIATFVC